MSRRELLEAELEQARQEYAQSSYAAEIFPSGSDARRELDLEARRWAARMRVARIELDSLDRIA